jgi:YD repeat-containing protein
MINNSSAAWRALITSTRPAIFVVALLLTICAAAVAQTITSSTGATSGMTPAGMAPGAPAGTYALSGFESVNYYSGSLNFHLPLAQAGGRGAVGHTITLEIEKKWRVQHTINDPNTYQSGLPTYDIEHTYTPIDYWWAGITPGYSPGVLQGRVSGSKHGTSHSCAPELNYYTRTLTRFTFTAGDGTEYELRDVQSGGRALEYYCSGEGASRGRVFVTADGSSATFISETEIRDFPVPIEEPTLPASGHLIMRDGTRYRVLNGRVKWMRDRNGNRMTFTYESEQYPEGPYGKVIKVIDSLGREVTIDGNEIHYGGIGGTQRTVRVHGGSLGNHLRPANAEHGAESLTTPDALFPTLDGSPNYNYNPGVYSAVELPDGRFYRFYYNRYGELARVELPTGGAFEYDWASGYENMDPTGLFPVAGQGGVDEYSIYRRVIERRVYAADGTLEGRMTIGRPEVTPLQGPGYVEVNHYDPRGVAAPGILLARERHYYLGSAAPATHNLTPIDYTDVFNGKEFKTEAFAADGVTLLRRVEHTWEAGTPLVAFTTQPVNPRITETKTTLADTNQVTKQTFSYDQFNNKTNVREYAFGTGQAGDLLRHTRTQYLGDVSYTNPTSATSTAETTKVHLRGLPLETSTYAGDADMGGTLMARTSFEYDNYTADANNALLVARPGIIMLDAEFADANYTKRGNVTRVSQWLNTTGGTLDAYSRYDVAGNVVSVKDARGKVSEVVYDDKFSDNQSRGTYAYPTKTISAVPDPTGANGSTTPLTSETTYDFSTGLVTSSKDANGHTTSFDYSDPLNRLKSVTRPDGGITTYQYPDPQVTTDQYVHTVTKFDATRNLEARQYFDGLGRATRSFTKVDSAKWSVVDSLHNKVETISGTQRRAEKASNPYFVTALSPTIPATGQQWTTTTFDALGRVLTVKTPDNATVSTAYSGNTVTVTDQAGKQRKSETDALGRLTKVTEAPEVATCETDGRGCSTLYTFDVLGNLRKVDQGGQLRFFAYDSLSRLIRAKNPEQSTTASLALPAPDPVSNNNGWSLKYTYDANGNLDERTDARNLLTKYTYDALNRNTTVTYTDPDSANAYKTPTVTRRYDNTAAGSNGKGRLWQTETSTTESAMGTRVTLTGYDTAGRPLGQEQQFATSATVWSAAYATSRTYNLAAER